MPKNSGPPRGRAASSNPVNRFERIEVASEIAAPERVPTLYLRDQSRSIISRNESPDVPFEISVNPYRGCEHGCIYCFARPFHEYLGFSAGLDFETRILVKQDAPDLLARELASPTWQPKTLAISGATDPYQPIERKLELTRRCLETLASFRNPAALITKNALVSRDIDHLSDLAHHHAVTVAISITTLDGDLVRVMEPRTSHPRERLAAIQRLTAAGIPCGVSIAPVIPGLTDHEIPAIIEAAAGAGAVWANWLLLRLPGAVRELFEDWLESRMPNRKARILNRLRQLREGELNDSRFGYRMRGQGVFAEQIRALFTTACTRHGIATVAPELATAAFHVPGDHQMQLFPA